MWQAVLVGGLVASTVDIGAAALIGWLNPIVILHAIASGVLGKAAFFDSGWSALLGLLLQWAMGVVIAGIYAAMAWHAPVLRRRWITTGAVYGLAIYLVMNLVVVPLSAAPFQPQFGAIKVVENLLAMILFGLIVSFCVSCAMRAASPRTETASPV